MVPPEGFEPSLSRLSIWCLFQLGYVGVELHVGLAPTRSAWKADMLLLNISEA
jgi:hypothetical protein